MTDKDLYGGSDPPAHPSPCSRGTCLWAGDHRRATPTRLRDERWHRVPDAARPEKKGYLTSRHERTGRRERRVYDITEQGRTALADAKTKVKELFGELVEGG